MADAARDSGALLRARGLITDDALARAHMVHRESGEPLDAVLTREELLDLLAFLQAQNGEQWLQPQRRSSR